MHKKYKASKVTRVMTLGLKEYNAEIIDDMLYLYTDERAKKVNIKEIIHISYDIRPIKAYVSSFLYIITTKNGDEIEFLNGSFDIAQLKELLNDLKSINPRMHYTNNILKLLKKDIPEKRKLKFDFTVHGSFFKRDAQFSQEHPSLDAGIGLIMVTMFAGIPFAMGMIGNNYFLDTYGFYYPVYRNVLMVLSGVAFCVGIGNIIIALVSQYLGHAVTIISLLLSITFLVIGLV